MRLSMVARGLAATLLLTATAAFVACGDDDEDEPTVTPTTHATAPANTATTTPAESATTEPTSTSTTTTATVPAGSEDGPIGVAALDAIADAVMSGNIPALVALIEYAELECTTAQGLGGPPKCEAGEAPGTRVDVLPFSTCEGEYLREANVEGVLTQQMSSPELHSAFELKDPGTDEYPRGEHGIIFAIAEGALMFGANDEGRIVSLSRGCGLSADELFEREHGETVHYQMEHD